MPSSMLDVPPLPPRNVDEAIVEEAIARPLTPEPISTGVVDPVLNCEVPEHASTGESHAPTESHALATADQEERGAVQDPAFNGEIDNEIKDLGWHKKEMDQIPSPLVGGIPNDELWVLVRRFNKQMYHVKSIPTAPPGGLDLNIAKEDEFSPDKLRGNVERLYMTVIIGLIGFAKHIARLRSWREMTRTAAFCSVYFLAWAVDLLAPVFFTMLVILIVYAPSRAYLFPPAPLALVDASTGGVKKPQAGMLGSHGSLTGAPEEHQGEAVEQEAHNFVTSFGAIALSSTIGKKSDSQAEEDAEHSGTEKSVPDPTDIAMKAADANKEASGEGSGTSHDKAKQPVEEVMWDKVRPTMHIIGDIADTWERLANALSPTPPFHKSTARVRFGTVLAPVILASLFVTPYMLVKGSSFLFGALFFGDPIITKVTPYLIENFGEYLDIRNTLLKGVPTNAQLTLTLLRLGEARKAPLPPPLSSSEPAANDVKPLEDEHIDNLPTNDTAEIADAMHPHTPPASDDEEKKPDETKHHPGRKIISFFKGTTKTGVNTSLSADPLKAKMGSKKAKNRLGAVPPSKAPAPEGGPMTFPARHQGKRGVIELLPSGDVQFTFEKKKEFLFSMPIGKIKELKKTGGLGWKSKLVVGWSLDRDVIDGIEIVDDAGQSWLLTAVHLRDELFNRLIAMGTQKWESW